MPLVVYFDEVGNPTLDATDKDFPVFAITLFICDTDCYVNDITPRVDRLKFKMNIIGTQMADLAAYPIARRVLDPKRPNRSYEIVSRGEGAVARERRTPWSSLVALHAAPVWRNRMPANATISNEASGAARATLVAGPHKAQY